MVNTTSVPSSGSTTSTESNSESNSRWTFNRILILATVGLVVLILLPFIIGLIVAIADPNGAAGFFEYVKNLLIIALSIQGILIVAGVAILVVQVARFVNLLRSEVKPITDDTRDVVRNVKVTTEFATKEGVRPIVQAQSFFAGLWVFTREIFKINRIVKRKK